MTCPMVRRTSPGEPGDLLPARGDERGFPRRRPLGAGRVRTSALEEFPGAAAPELLLARKLEGVVAKRRDGVYDPAATTWWKVKNVNYSQARDRHELFQARAAR